MRVLRRSSQAQSRSRAVCHAEPLMSKCHATDKEKGCIKSGSQSLDLSGHDPSFETLQGATLLSSAQHKSWTSDVRLVLPQPSGVKCRLLPFYSDILQASCHTST